MFRWMKEPQNLYNFKDKTKCIDNKISYMLARTQSMFTYTGLPDTLNSRIIELYLQVNGNLCITNIEKDIIDKSGHPDLTPGLYAFTGGLGGEYDIYYMPTIYAIANPYLNYSKNLKIDEECVVIPSDSMYYGLLPLFQKYATALTENELSMNIATIVLRLQAIISASDDNVKKSAEKYLKDITDGKLGIIADNEFLENSLKVTPYATTGAHTTIQNIIELEQYLRATWYNDLGLNSNYNMKRESINAGESQLNNDALLPLVDNMLKCRKDGFDKVNKKYGTNIQVELNSSWKFNADEIENESETDKESDETDKESVETNDGIQDSE